MALRTFPFFSHHSKVSLRLASTKRWATPPRKSKASWSRYINYAGHTAANYCSHCHQIVLYYARIIVVCIINIHDATLFIITLQGDLMMRAGNFSYNATSDNKRDKKTRLFRQAPRAYLIHYRFDRSSSSIRKTRSPGANETAPEPLRSRLITIGM